MKLTELRETLELTLGADHSDLADAIKESANRSVLAAGSGGSAISAAYFARCRETLFDSCTQVVTPMELALGVCDLDGQDVWLFSAGADHPDFTAALHSARARQARRINLVTRRRDAAETPSLRACPNLTVHRVPVANMKDSFLATHSLASSVTAVLIASNLASNDPASSLEEAFLAAALAELDENQRRIATDEFASLTSDDTLLIVADPQVASVSTLLETSIWEASIASVQLTDFRNFAHGRHTWLHRRSDKTVMLALTGHDTEELWERISKLLPSSLRLIRKDFGNCGRFQNAVGIIQGLVWIEAMGRAVDIDPGKPGVEDFGDSLYRDDALQRLSLDLGPAVRQKRRATLHRDDPTCGTAGIIAAARNRLRRFSTAEIGGIVFDYDGTIVPTEQRLSQPAQMLINEVRRLHELGVQLAVATGRGGSAGEMLREVLPRQMHQHILIGYYNGGYLKQLDVDICKEPPDEIPEIVRVADWLASRSDLFLEPFEGKQSRVQISLQLNTIRDLEQFEREIASCDPIASGSVRITHSGHSVDLIPARSSKTNVADRLAETLGADVVILRVGDQGSRNGNDNDFLTHPFGISVKDVCGREEGCWSLFGAELTGPQALIRLLRSLKPTTLGRVHIDLRTLELDVSPEMGTNAEHDAPRD